MKQSAMYRKFQPRLAVSLALFVLAGCGIAPPAVPPTPLVELVNPSVEATEHWKRKVGKGSDYAGAAFEPAVADGLVYAAAADGTVSALAVASGELAWQVDLKQTIRSGVAVDTQSVYLATRDGQIIALGREAGVEQWRTSLNREILEPPVVSGGHVLARAANGDVLSLDTVTGKQMWRYSAKVPELSVRGSAAPLWVPGGYLIPLDDGRLVALDERNGRTVWEAIISEPRGSTAVERIVDVDTRPVVIDDIVIVGSRRGDLVALNGQNGKTLWRRQLSAVSSLAHADDQLFVVEQNGEVSGILSADGSSQWQQKNLRGRRLTAPVVYNGHLIVGDLDGYLHWLALDSGKIVGRERLSRAAIFAAAVVSDDSLIVLDQAGRLARYQAVQK